MKNGVKLNKFVPLTTRAKNYNASLKLGQT